MGIVDGKEAAVMEEFVGGIGVIGGCRNGKGEIDEVRRRREKLAWFFAFFMAAYPEVRKGDDGVLLAAEFVVGLVDEERHG